VVDEMGIEPTTSRLARAAPASFSPALSH